MAQQLNFQRYLQEYQSNVKQRVERHIVVQKLLTTGGGYLKNMKSKVMSRCTPKTLRQLGRLIID
jgi:hypothetical protein